MADSFLERFYVRIGPFAGLANSLRLAMIKGDSGAMKSCADDLLSQAKLMQPEIQVAKAFKAEEAEWKLNYDSWKHGDRQGKEPIGPNWPESLPRVRDALDAMHYIGDLEEGAQLVAVFRHWTHPDIVQLAMVSLNSHLNAIQALIESSEDEGNGPIDRDELGSLLLISPKTIANNAQKLPEPIARTSRQVPIFNYHKVRIALINLYPAKANMLPESYEAARATLEKQDLT